MTNLHNLASKGDTEGVRKLLKKSAAKVNSTDRDGQTALHCGAKAGHVDVCRELLASVANVEAEDAKHRTPLLVAVENNKAKVTKVLCEAGASTSLASPSDGCTPLHVAAKKGFVECAEVLLQHGAPIDGNPDKWGNLPEDNCTMSEIRVLIVATRRERTASAASAGVTGFTSPYNPHVATAPSLVEEIQESDGSPYFCAPSPTAPPSYYESECASLEGKGGGLSKPEKALSPMSQAKKAAEVGGDRCAGCDSPERSRQLTPCHHVVCRACTRRARDEEEDGCPVCHTRVFDDNPVFM